MLKDWNVQQYFGIILVKTGIRCKNDVRHNNDHVEKLWFDTLLKHSKLDTMSLKNVKEAGDLITSRTSCLPLSAALLFLENMTSIC
jgi:hypothetical protein